MPFLRVICYASEGCRHSCSCLPIYLMYTINLFTINLLTNNHMKLTKFAAMAAATALLAACSSEDNLNVPVDVNAPATQGVTVKFNLGLAGADALPTGRAVGYDKGTEAENKVQSGVVYIFEKQNTGGEDAAKMVAKGSLTFTDNNTLADANVAKTITGVTATVNNTAENFKVEKSADNYLALVVLNAGTGFIAPAEDETFGTWRVKTINEYKDASSNFTMTNATDATGNTLVPMIDQSIVNGEPIASTGIYVQRVAAKVSITNTKLATAQTVGEGSDKAKIDSWKLDITNKTSYPVMNVDGLTFTDAWMHSGDTDFDRAFWCKDPNYDGGYTLSDAFNRGTTFGTTATDYVLENTFSIADQDQDKTTRVVFKGVYYPGGISTAASFFKFGTTLHTIETLGVDGVTAFEDVESGARTISEMFGEKADDVAAALGVAKTASFDFYKDGVVYYTYYIKHFAATNAESVAWESGNYAANHLGRYGVVRNNVYDITVNSVTGLGSPVDPDPEDVQDDVTPEEEGAAKIQCTLNILSWAKRTQDADL